MSEEIERFARIEPPAERVEPTIRIGLEIEVQTDEGPKIVTVGKTFPAAGADVKFAMRPLPSFDRAAMHQAAPPDRRSDRHADHQPDHRWHRRRH